MFKFRLASTNKMKMNSLRKKNRTAVNSKLWSITWLIIVMIDVLILKPLKSGLHFQISRQIFTIANFWNGKITVVNQNSKILVSNLDFHIIKISNTCKYQLIICRIKKIIKSHHIYTNTYSSFLIIFLIFFPKSTTAIVFWSKGRNKIFLYLRMIFFKIVLLFD